MANGTCSTVRMYGVYLQILTIMYFTIIRKYFSNFKLSSLQKNIHHLPHIHLLPPDDELQMGPKHVEVW
jgi:hypothetical protein